MKGLLIPTPEMLLQRVPRLYALRPHALQQRFGGSAFRFNVIPGGRRSGKTEIAKRRLRGRALARYNVTHSETAFYFAAAPTRDQAKRIFWSDFKKMFRPFFSREPNESDLIIYAWPDVEIHVVGMDKPERIEGTPWDGGILDEYANMKERVWGSHVRPALADRNGFCDLIGVPEGRNHYFHLYERARADMATMGRGSEWGAYTWKSADILPAAEIEAAKRDLDELTFAQEYEGSFVSFLGRAYYGFDDTNKLRLKSLYDPRAPLILCFDFNVSPGVAAVCQELYLKTLPDGPPRAVTCVIGEVWIPSGSNTQRVCRRLCKDWAERHRGRVDVYGDATGGSNKTSGLSGTDWDIVRETLRHGDPSRSIRGFGDRVWYHVPSENPVERHRVNAMNSRILNTFGVRNLFVDPDGAPHVVHDLEGVRTLSGGSGELDKNTDKLLTHISDALGYYVAQVFPIGDHSAVSTAVRRP